MIGILAGLAEVLEAWVSCGVGDDLGLHFLSDKAGEALRDSHPHAADRLGPQADGGGKNQAGAIWFEQIHGTDVGLKPLADQKNDVVERFGGTAAA